MADMTHKKAMALTVEVRRAIQSRHVPTLHEAKAIAKAYGCKLRSIPEFDEYQVTLEHGTFGDAQTYYTDDLQDAVGTARCMRWKLEEKQGI